MSCERMNEIGQHRQRPRRDPGQRCRKSKRKGLRRDVAEQQHDDEHRGRRDDRCPFVAEPRQQNDRREAVGEDVARLVQPDDDDQRLERPAHQAVERVLHGQAHLLARMLQPRQREQRGLGRGQHRAQHDEDQDRKRQDGHHQLQSSRATATDPILRQSARYHQSRSAACPERSCRFAAPPTRKRRDSSDSLCPGFTQKISS